LTGGARSSPDLEKKKEEKRPSAYCGEEKRTIHIPYFRRPLNLGRGVELLIKTVSQKQKLMIMKDRNGRLQPRPPSGKKGAAPSETFIGNLTTPKSIKLV